MSVGGTSTAVTLDSQLFELRWKRFQETWDIGFKDPNSPWYGVDTFILLSGRQDEEHGVPKTGQLHLWFFGYVFAETLLISLRNQQTFCLTGPRKLNYLKQLKRDDFIFLEKSTQDINKNNIETIIKAIDTMRKSQNNDKILTSELKFGRIRGKNEDAVGAFAEQTEEALLQLAPLDKYPEMSLHDPLSTLIAIHDPPALECSIKAASLAVALMKEVLISRVEYVLDSDARESHVDIANRAEKALDDKKKQERWKAKYNLDPTLVDLAYVNIQSGTIAELKPSALPTSDMLSTAPGTIILSLGTKYKDLSANVVRTLLFNTNKKKRLTYQFTLEVLEYAIEQLTPGKPFNEVYETVRSYVHSKQPALLPYLTKSLGHTLSLEFRDPLLVLNGRSSGVVKSGMIFNISVGFANLQIKEDMDINDPNNNKPYSIWLADTVEIQADGSSKVLTGELDRRLKSVNYEIAEEEDVNEKKVSVASNGEKKKKSPTTIQGSGDTSNNTSMKSSGTPGVISGDGRKSSRQVVDSVVLRDRLRSRGKATAVDDTEKLIAKQRILRERKIEEIRERFRDGGGQNLSTNKRSVKKMTTLAAYRDPSEFPKDLKQNRMHLDLVREAVLVPIPGFGHVPFHASTIRNIVCQAEDKKFYTVRLQFQVPGTIGFGYKSETNPFPDVSGPNGMFVKEMIFRSSNPQLPHLCKSVKELQKRIKQREETGDISADLVVQPPLELNKRGGKRVLLKSVMAKGGTNNRRVAGTLEAHLNGLRFSGGRIENIDINYINIKHAFFQPCENELVVLIHFHLKSPILINKKRTFDVQFYTEVGSQTDDLDQRRGRSSYDPDEIAEEQRERELKRRLNIEFKKFVESVEEMARSNGEKLEFEIPFRELGFYGVPKNSSQYIIPTARCLVQLTEWPVFVLTLDEIEIVSFERICHGLRQFDMVFLFKDYTKPVRQITTIPVKSLDTIKKWLNEIDIVWYEYRSNLNWTEIFKTIRDDIVHFVKVGAFEYFLSQDRDQVDHANSGSETDEEDENYENESSDEYSEGSSESDEDENGESSDEDESLASENDSSDASERTDGSDDDEEEEEESLTWEELEKRALQEDRKRSRHGKNDDDDDDDGKRPKKRKNK